MKKYVSYLWIALVFWFGFAGPSFAQAWKKSVDFGLTLTQNSYSNNWTGGEAGNVSWVALANSVLEKKFSETLNSRITAKFSFGQTHSQDQEAKKWSKPIKSTDLVDIETLSRFTLKAWVDPYFAFRFESQFVDASVAQSKDTSTPKS